VRSSKRNDVYLAFAKTQRGFDGFHQTRSAFVADSDTILNDLHAGAEAFDLWLGIHAHNFVVDPHAQIALLLKKIEESAWLSLCRNRNPKRDQHIFAIAVAQNVLGD
jgi:hypothetical protein